MKLKKSLSLSTVAPWVKSLGMQQIHGVIAVAGGGTVLQVSVHAQPCAAFRLAGRQGKSAHVGGGQYKPYFVTHAGTDVQPQQRLQAGGCITTRKEALKRHAVWRADADARMRIAAIQP